MPLMVPLIFVIDFPAVDIPLVMALVNVLQCPVTTTETFTSCFCTTQTSISLRHNHRFLI